MNSLIKFLLILTPLTKRIGTCGNVGLLAGTIAGIIISLTTWLIHTAPLLTSSNQAIILASLLSIFSWSVIIFVLCALVQLSIKSIALPALFNCILTCFFTVFITKELNIYNIAWLIGMLIGAIVGGLLCRINFILNK